MLEDGVVVWVATKVRHCSRGSITKSDQLYKVMCGKYRADILQHHCCLLNSVIQTIHTSSIIEMISSAQVDHSVKKVLANFNYLDDDVPILNSSVQGIEHIS